MKYIVYLTINLKSKINGIEKLESVKAVKEKYKVPASKIKNIQLGDRYYKDLIFKYCTRNNSK